jgi:beta-alanine degradation protein BauB
MLKEQTSKRGGFVMAVDAKAGIELGPIGDKVIFENDAVRVWTFSVGPGGIKKMHRHDLDYVIVPMTGGKAEITTIEGKARLTEDKVGSIIWQDAGETHQLKNLNDHEYRNILVELKGRPAKPKA